MRGYGFISIAVLPGAVVALALLAGCGPVQMFNLASDIAEKLDKEVDRPQDPAPTAAPAPAVAAAPPVVDAGASDGCAQGCDSGAACCGLQCNEDFGCATCKPNGAVCNYEQGGGCCLGTTCEPLGENGNGYCLSCRRSGDPIPKMGDTPLVRVCCSKRADATGTRCE